MAASEARERLEAMSDLGLIEAVIALSQVASSSASSDAAEAQMTAMGTAFRRSRQMCACSPPAERTSSSATGGWSARTAVANRRPALAAGVPTRRNSTRGPEDELLTFCPDCVDLAESVIGDSALIERSDDG